MVEGIFHGGRLEAAMDHAIGAFFVIAGAIGVPVGFLHQLLESGGVAFAEQIAGPLPAKHRASGITPRRAPIGSIAGEKVEKKLRLEKGPRLAALVASENLPEQGLDVLAIEEMLL